METNAQDGVADSSISEGGDGKETQAGRVVKPEKVGKEGEARKSRKAPKAPKTESDFLVVGIGASAGGLTAIEQFFDHLPGNVPGMAFVVVVHLSPEHESNLASILQGHTLMPVTQVIGRVKIAPNHVYVIPPGKQLSMDDEHLRLSKSDLPRERRVPIDLFFRTLAETHSGWAAAIVLSGTGSDGSIGLPRVKEMGGLTLAQDPTEAEHDPMPKSAIATGFVDYVLPVASMGEQLLNYLHRRQTVNLQVEDAEGATDSAGVENADEQAQVVLPDTVNEILALLLARTGHDFSPYKRSTLMRRIERRIQVNNSPDLASYLAFLRRHPGEIQLLLRDLLISVTNFFRDKEVWDAVETEVIPALFQGKENADSVVRVWVAGCATGEEAYSVAILLHEYAARHNLPTRLQVFASDLDDHAIAVARQGIYPENIDVDVSPERLNNFFTHSGSRYRVSKEVRDTLLFAHHDILKDPPFSRVDLVSCRNLLIYLDREAQGRLLTLFHFALNPNKYLLLGTSESVEGMAQLYTPLDKKHHIYMRRTMSLTVNRMPTLQQSSAAESDAMRQRLLALPAASTRARSFSPASLHQDILERYAPPSVIVDEDQNIVHLSDNAGRYMQVEGGELSSNILRMLHPDLRLDLRGALYAAAQTGKPSETRRLRLQLGGADRFVRLIVRPVQEPEGLRGFTLIIFDEIEQATDDFQGLVPGRGDGADGKQFDETLARQLEEEVQLLKGQLRNTVQQYETSVEELKASNEELQAINEELRSASEELETSKEEMQAVNEELLAVNQELKIKIEEVSHANSDLQNLILSTDTATIFLNRQMRVKRYTPRVTNLFNIIPTDSDRPITHITHKMLYNTLVQDAESVLSSLSQITREVQTTEGEWYIVRVLPYRTVEDRIDGVVMTFTGITERKRAEAVLRVSEESFRAVANLAPNLLWRNDLSGEATWYNQQWLEYTGQKPEKGQGYGWLDVIHPDDREQARSTFMAAIESGQPVSQEDRIRGADGSYRWFLIRAEPVLDENGKVIEWYGAATDVEEQHTALDASEADVVSRTEELRKLSSRLLVAQEEERRRIARELHDEIGQYLTGLRFMLEKLSTSFEQEGTEGQIAPSLEVLSHLTERVRNLALDLRPTMLDDLGLLHALLWYVQRYQSQTGIEVSFHHMGLEERLPTDVETVVYRVVQEALTNVARHSEARQVTLQLFSDGQVTAVIEDQGKGFDVAKAFARHTSTGLSAMRERVALVGGEFSAESSPGRGTTIIVNIPIAGNP